MISVKEIPDDIAQKMKNEGTIIPDLYSKSPLTAIVLTQSWCPQWENMKKMFSELQTESSSAGDINIWFIEYDKKPYFEEFMNFKESVFENDQVPFVLYYCKDALVNQSNFVSKASFLENFKEA